MYSINFKVHVIRLTQTAQNKLKNKIKEIVQIYKVFTVMY